MTYSLKRIKNTFSYILEASLAEEEETIIEMPEISPNKMRLDEIGWQTDGDITLYGTLSSDAENAIWQEIKSREDINKAVAFLKVVNNAGACNIVIRAMLS